VPDGVERDIGDDAGSCESHGGGERAAEDPGLPPASHEQGIPEERALRRIRVEGDPGGIVPDLEVQLGGPVRLDQMDRDGDRRPDRDSNSQGQVKGPSPIVQNLFPRAFLYSL
jgi:hypothetical protein